MIKCAYIEKFVTKLRKNRTAYHSERGTNWYASTFFFFPRGVSIFVFVMSEIVKQVVNGEMWWRNVDLASPSLLLIIGLYERKKLSVQVNETAYKCLWSIFV